MCVWRTVVLLVLLHVYSKYQLFKQSALLFMLSRVFLITVIIIIIINCHTTQISFKTCLCRLKTLNEKLLVRQYNYFITN